MEKFAKHQKDLFGNIIPDREGARKTLQLILANCPHTTHFCNMCGQIARISSYDMISQEFKSWFMQDFWMPNLSKNERSEIARLNKWYLFERFSDDVKIAARRLGINFSKLDICDYLGVHTVYYGNLVLQYLQENRTFEVYECLECYDMDTRLNGIAIYGTYNSIFDAVYSLTKGDSKSGRKAIKIV